MAQPQAGFQLKFPKPNRFDDNPSYYRPWMAKVKLYFNSYGVTDDQSRINYTLGLLDGAAKLWQQDYRLSQATAATQAGYTPHTFDEFKNALEQSFAPTQQSFEAERELRYYRQQSKYIKEYITNFSILASCAGLTDSTSLQSYFAKGLDNNVRFEAIQADPQTLAEWKTAARQAYKVVQEQKRYRIGNSTPGSSNRSRKTKKNSRQYRSQPQYNDIHNQPISRPRRSEWDMDIDRISRGIY
ncbi:hypothetical protein D9756_011391 [Leucocoprinus leucothites]|uniref:Retrotransposon gag domain-containing protein n=1 Tax=Leucocoprinus leucothites TaxID=201217 RepID=A0A8H5CSR6_9AGAR|nr:hypothetical protein D9756_011391 [Leucoagaricus leucothites]